MNEDEQNLIDGIVMAAAYLSEYGDMYERSAAFLNGIIKELRHIEKSSHPWETISGKPPPFSAHIARFEVPGGWIYVISPGWHGQAVTSVFVPNKILGPT